MTHLEKGKQVQCDIDEICSKTNAYIYDEDEYMDLDEKERDVIYLWGKITSMSRLEKIEKSKGKEMMAYYLKTLEKIEIVLDNTDWSVMHITEQDAINLIQLFHVTYNHNALG